MANNDGKMNFSINFAPEQILETFENELKKNFCTKLEKEANAFLEEGGAGLLLIREFLEKKFDDPKTVEAMDKFWEHNFERILEAAMEKALTHKLNDAAFHKAEEPKTAEKITDIMNRINSRSKP